jgi:hypothetical protein
MDLPRLKITSSDYIKERYTHILLLGKSGTGKSSMIANWWRQDCFWKSSKILIEPSGFLARDCYSLSKGQSLYCSLDTPISINPMQAPYNPNQISDNVAECLNQVIKLTTSNQELTVKMRAILDEAIKYCLSNNRRSLVNVKDYINNMKGNIETRDGIIQRLNFLLNDERMLPILCGNNTVNWGQLISKKQSFILDSFGMGREKMIFAGNVISQSIKNYFRFERPKKYEPLALYVDECHNFINQNFMDILKEGRKFKLSCVLSTQDMSFDERLARIMLNVGNIVSFRLGAREAQMIARELNFQAQDLQFIEKHHVAFLTQHGTGIGKSPRPPFIRPLEPKRPEPKSESKGWFVLEPYQAFSPS